MSGRQFIAVMSHSKPQTVLNPQCGKSCTTPVLCLTSTQVVKLQVAQRSSVCNTGVLTFYSCRKVQHAEKATIYFLTAFNSVTHPHFSIILVHTVWALVRLLQTKTIFQLCEDLTTNMWKIHFVSKRFCFPAGDCFL